MEHIEEIPERLMSIGGLGGRVAYDHFSTEQALPFCCYTFDMKTEGADDMHSVRRTSVTVELYQESPDYSLISELLDTFTDVPADCGTVYLDSEKMYMTVMKFEFLQKRKD